MNNLASSGIISLFLISMFVLSTAAISNELILNNDTVNENVYDVSKYNEIIDDTIEEISTFFNIKQVLGKYYYDNQYTIKKIVILIKPYVDLNLDISDLYIQLSNGDISKILVFNKQIDYVGSYDVFEHPNWNKIINGCYSALIVSDEDNSILDYNTINQNSDMLYIIINLNDYFNFHKGDIISVTLLPNNGIIQTLRLESPLPIQKIVNLY